MSFLYHITDWPYSGSQALSPPSLSTEGFVHLSSESQLLPTAERWYSQHSQVGVLVLDSAALAPSTLRWEDLYGHGQEFPHLYQAIPLEAVCAVVKLCRSTEGRFLWPEALVSSVSPLFEGPDAGEALIEPTRRFPNAALPPVAILHFFPEVMERLRQLPGAEVYHGLGSAVGPDPVIVLEKDGHRFVACSPGVGGPLAAVALEELIALGCRRFVACGGAGSLVAGQPLGALVLVEDAVRDEGLSHHYLLASEKVDTESGALRSAAATMSSLGVSFRQGRTWTIDALYRETPARLERRKALGCLTVEMECASLLAVAQYRGIPLVPLLYCGDDLGSDTWSFRDWTSAHDVQEQLFWLAVRVGLNLEP